MSSVLSLSLLCRKGILSLVFVLFTQSVYAQIEITDSHGKYRFAKSPERVVVLNWALAEQMMELGEMPVGMADVDGYRSHTKQVAPPDSVISVGDRLSPSLRKIRALKPEIILIGYSQRSLIRPLSNIATVIYFKNFGKRYNNQDKSRERFLELAKLFDKTQLAQTKLSERDQRLTKLKEKLQQAYAGRELPGVQFIVPDVSNAAKNGASLLFGVNSMPFYAAQALGLSVVAPQGSDQFGMSQLASSQLEELVREHASSLCQFHLSSYSQGASPQSTSFPKALFPSTLAKGQSTKSACVETLSYQNAFGGIMSILYLAESIAHSLLTRVNSLDDSVLLIE